MRRIAKPTTKAGMRKAFADLVDRVNALSNITATGNIRAIVGNAGVQLIGKKATAITTRASAGSTVILVKTTEAAGANAIAGGTPTSITCNKMSSQTSESSSSIEVFGLLVGTGTPDWNEVVPRIVADELMLATEIFGRWYFVDHFIETTDCS